IFRSPFLFYQIWNRNSIGAILDVLSLALIHARDPQSFVRILYVRVTRFSKRLDRNTAFVSHRPG
ncbi:MAG TPA: hypothetical protein PLF98_07850, partial [Thermotogota bacterium]|nr:hypothetical protein [Thermotogota bacterium]